MSETTPVQAAPEIVVRYLPVRPDNKPKSHAAHFIDTNGFAHLKCGRLAPINSYERLDDNSEVNCGACLYHNKRQRINHDRQQALIKRLSRAREVPDAVK